MLMKRKGLSLAKIFQNYCPLKVTRQTIPFTVLASMFLGLRFLTKPKSEFTGVSTKRQRMSQLSRRGSVAQYIIDITSR